MLRSRPDPVYLDIMLSIPPNLVKAKGGEGGEGIKPI